MNDAPDTDNGAANTGPKALGLADIRHPVNFLALGLGAGLSPKAPGTVGTLLAVPLAWLLTPLQPWGYLLVVIVVSLVGIAICDSAARRLGVHDHPGIVFDEIAGYLLTMWALPATPAWLLAGFVVFRVLDIAKPWPIRVLDRRVDGGLGIMVDDLLAGAIGCAILHAALGLVD